ncbi:MAG: globin domain-containing protein [Chloroflexi bacterium]|nr:globin domain-containing protein [Chloroflexota bacterium]MCI0577371.1 globin domain-containing protein [Chloroflexota bacterium]MCI0647058.1 globin domain-containing protein [Chloroflexota bacterium]MCI0731545.1 globin domain-containing protein [Chloroflexota bacterium]
MTPKQIELVQETFALVAPMADQAAALFYARLFTLDPSLRPLFRSNMDEQGKKLMATLTLVVRDLQQPETIIAAVQHLGQRHATYGVQPAHYNTVGSALLWTLNQGLGDRFTAEVEAAWTAAYTLLADLMLEAAAQTVPLPA